MTTAVLANPHGCFDSPTASNKYGDTPLEYMISQPSATVWNNVSSQSTVNKPNYRKPVVPDIDDVTTNTWLKSAFGVGYAAEKFRRLLEQLINSILIPYRNELAERICDLYQMAIEEDPESGGISGDSLNNFTKFMNSSKLKMLPSISLTEDNNIYASWKKGTGHVFSICFLPTGDVQFVVFIPNSQDPGKKTRVSGSTTIESLMQTVESNVRDWLMA